MSLHKSAINAIKHKIMRLNAHTAQWSDHLTPATKECTATRIAELYNSLSVLAELERNLEE